MVKLSKIKDSIDAYGYCNTLTATSIRSLIDIADQITTNPCLTFEEQEPLINAIFQIIRDASVRVIKLGFEITNVLKPMLTIIAVVEDNNGHKLTINHLIYWDTMNEQWVPMNTGLTCVYASYSAQSRVANAVTLRQ